MWIAAAFGRNQPLEPEYCSDPAVMDPSAHDLPAHVCAGVQWREGLLPGTDNGPVAFGLGRGGIPDRRQNHGCSDHDFHSAVLPDFIYWSIFLPRRALPPPAVRTLSN